MNSQKEIEQMIINMVVENGLQKLEKNGTLIFRIDKPYLIGEIFLKNQFEISMQQETPTLLLQKM